VKPEQRGINHVMHVRHAGPTTGDKKWKIQMKKKFVILKTCYMLSARESVVCGEKFLMNYCHGEKASNPLHFITTARPCGLRENLKYPPLIPTHSA
jgi:hypothetical protein